MKRNATSTLLAILISFGLVMSTFLPNRVAGQSAIVYVDDDNSGGPWDGSLVHPYANITSGLEQVSSGDTLYVFNGVYIENIFVNKSVSIVGEDPVNTIVDGNGTEFLSVIHIDTINNIIIANLTIQNTASGFGGGAGILIWQSNNVTVTNCTVTRSFYGLKMSSSTGCRIYENKVVDNYAYGIDLRDGSTNNTLIGNLVANNPTGIYVAEASSQYNRFYRNNIMNNTNQHDLYGVNFWDNGAEGNHWDDYSGSDLNGDGIGDSPYAFEVDMFPLMEPWSRTRVYSEIHPAFSVVCNYTIASVEFNGSRREISFHITGPSSWRGFCNVDIPIEVLRLENTSEKWMVTLGSNPLIYNYESESDSTIISFGFTLGSSMLDNRVRITVEVLTPPNVGFSFSPADPVINEIVTFNASSSFDPDGTITRYIWNFSDGSPIENGQVVTHAFNNAGNFEVTLKVYDNQDVENTTTRTVTVNNVDNSGTVDYALLAVSAFIVIAIFCFGLIIWKRKRSAT